MHTSGNGKMKDVIYHIYGREIANQSDPHVEFEKDGVKLSGYLGEASDYPAEIEILKIILSTGVM